MREKMRTRKALILAVIGAAVFVGCATQEAQKPPPPAPAPAPAPAPEVRARAVEVPKPAPEPKKPAIINLASTELFEFNKATLTPEARTRLDAEVIAKMKDVADIRYVNVNGHADRLGSPQYNQRLSEK